MKKLLSFILAVATAAALMLPAAALTTASPLDELPDGETYYVTNYDTDKQFHLSFSQVLESSEPQMGNIEITIRQGGILRCDGDYGFMCLAQSGTDRWYTYNSAKDANAFSSRGIKVTPTRVIRTSSATNSQYTSGYTWQFNRGGTYEIVAGCGFYNEPEYLKFTVTVLTEEPNTITTQFSDVTPDKYYALPVTWAVEQGITTGTTPTTFSPAIPCTNAQIITFMWRANGSLLGIADYSETGISDHQYYTNAVRWAVDAGIIPNAPFDPQKPCTRAMAIEYFWRLAGAPIFPTPPTFTDVPADASYAQAVGWATVNGITTGGTATTFSPNDICTRAQIVTFLYRAMHQ